MSESKSPKSIFKIKNSSFSKREQVYQPKTNSKVEAKTTSKFSQRQHFKSTTDTSYAESYVSKPKIDFAPQKPNFPNLTKKQTMEASYEKGIASRKNIDHCLEGKGKIYQSSKYSKDQINEAYEKYVNTSSNGSSSSKDSTILVKAWKPVIKAQMISGEVYGWIQIYGSAGPDG